MQIFIVPLCSNYLVQKQKGDFSLLKPRKAKSKQLKKKMHNLPHDRQATLTCALSTPREPVDMHNSPAPFSRIFYFFPHPIISADRYTSRSSGSLCTAGLLADNAEGGMISFSLILCLFVSLSHLLLLKIVSSHKFRMK